MKPDYSSQKKGTWIAGAILATAAVSGYFMGLNQTGSTINMAPPMELPRADGTERRAVAGTNPVPIAVSYSRQDWLKEGPNAAWSNHLAHLARPPVPTVGPTNLSEADRSRALQARSTRRAFDGAPPVVPHPISEASSSSCLACHGQGLVVKDRVAPKMSHAAYGSCTQCHVSGADRPIPGAEMALRAPVSANDFMSTALFRKGDRAWAEAPPTIPHPTFMRSDCMSCHGPMGLFGLRTPHPERQSCTQCHVPKAELDQHRFLSEFLP